MSPRHAFLQQTLLLVALSLLCGGYIWCAVLTTRRTHERTEREHYLSEARHLCATLAPTLHWQGRFETIPVNGARYGSTDCYDQGQPLLNMRWNLDTGQLVNVGIPAPDAGTPVILGASAPVRTQGEALHRGQKLLLQLGQKRWLFASLLTPPRYANGIWTLTYRASPALPLFLPGYSHAELQKALVKIDAQQGALRLFRVFERSNAPQN